MAETPSASPNRPRGHERNEVLETSAFSEVTIGVKMTQCKYGQYADVCSKFFR